MKTESCIVHENARYWVEQTPGAYFVWRTGDTHSVRVAFYGKYIANALPRAIADADARNARAQA
jgi:hypothetical protein